MLDVNHESLIMQRILIELTTPILLAVIHVTQILSILFKALVSNEIVFKSVLSQYFFKLKY